MLLGKKSIQGVCGDLMSGIASSSISVAGSEEQINFSQQTPKILKMASESFYSCFLLFLGLFLKISCRVPLLWFCLHKCLP